MLQNALKMPFSVLFRTSLLQEVRHWRDILHGHTIVGESYTYHISISPFLCCKMLWKCRFSYFFESGSYKKWGIDVKFYMDKLGLVSYMYMLNFKPLHYRGICYYAVKCSKKPFFTFFIFFQTWLLHEMRHSCEILHGKTRVGDLCAYQISSL